MAEAKTNEKVTTRVELHGDVSVSEYTKQEQELVQKHPGNRIRDTSQASPKSSKPKSSTSTKAPPKPPIPTTSTTTLSKSKSHHHHHLLPLELSQRILDIFSTAFANRLNNVAQLKADIQTLKGYLFNRDFEKAFSDEEALEAYAVRWSPVRALGYLSLFTSIDCIRTFLHEGGGGERGDVVRRRRRRRKVVCLGGGAGAEVVAFAGLLCQLYMEERRAESGEEQADEDGKWVIKAEAVGSWDIVVVDIAPWQGVLRKLENAVTTGLKPSSDTSDSTTTMNGPLVQQENLAVTFKQQDVLEMGSEELRVMCHEANMVTLMFTLNELYSTSVPKTTKLLLDLTASVGRGCMLVVVDSPGSYSSLTMNKLRTTGASAQVGAHEAADEDGTKEITEKRYPMQWLLDHTLLKAANTKSGKEGRGKEEGEGEGEKQWEKVHSEDSRWFRLRGELKYPIALEDMRMQVHIFRKL
ncbi:MAG: hypothetical protein Q9213_005641 [Squamulea squamosa]